MKFVEMNSAWMFILANIEPLVAMNRIASLFLKAVKSKTNDTKKINNNN
jgi:hypothetical protein